MPARLLLGPLLRWASGSEATVWVETDAPCEVEVLGHRARTFSVAGHHYALVVVRGLAPGAATEYAVALDGRIVWPAPGLAAGVIRTPAPGEPVRVAFGSCRVADAGEPFYGPDALVAFARRARRQAPEERPNALLLIGDQIYADNVSRATLSFIARRRSPLSDAGTSLADYAEYAHEYRVAWREPDLRWLLSSVPTAMIFDDHDVHDDWNTSADWVVRMRTKPWWRERVLGAFMSYWVYQHLGNLSPGELERDELFAAVRAAGDATELLRGFAGRAEADPSSARWSWARQVGGARVVAMDTRAGRVLTPGARAMLDDDEWSWCAHRLSGEDCDHLLVVTSLPWLLSTGLHYVEAWNEAVCDGAWGRWAARRAERLRQNFDFEHWGAFRRSFDRLADELATAGSGGRGPAPASICVLAGDVHHGYVQEVAWPRSRGVTSAAWHIVGSPFRHPLGRRHHAQLGLGASRPFHVAARLAARLAGVPDPPVRWRFRPRRFVYANHVVTLTLEGRSARMVLETAPHLEPAIAMKLA